MKILITICARGGSKGIPGKNIKMINDKPLIAYTINCAREFAKQHNATIALSTDDATIKQVAADHGLNTDYTRGEALASDTAGKIDVLRDLLKYEEQKADSRFDILLDLDVTSPLRNAADPQTAYADLISDENCLTLFSVNPANRNPYFNMVEQGANGYVQLSKKLDGAFLTRQSAPKVYDVNASFYFYKRAFFETQLKTPITENTKVFVMEHTCFDLDHPVDFDFMEYLLVNHKLGFEFNY